MTQAPDVVYIAVTHADSTISVTSFVTNDYHGVVQEPTNENIEAVLAKVAAAYAGDPNMASKVPFQSWRIIDKADIPTDRSYRNAWRDTGNGLGHDMAHARNIHKDKLRREREPKLAALDVAYQKADEQGDNQKKQQIAAQKQALRDITADPRIATAATIEQLKAVVIQ